MIDLSHLPDPAAVPADERARLVCAAVGLPYEDCLADAIRLDAVTGCGQVRAMAEIVRARMLARADVAEPAAPVVSPANRASRRRGRKGPANALTMRTVRRQRLK